MSYLFDTNIILHYLRESEVMQFVEAKYHPFDADNETWVSIISFGELRSLAIQNQWGKPRLERLSSFLGKLIPMDIYAEDIFERYAEIDAFSQDKYPAQPLGYSSRNMGKNDLWIAASASILGATFLTTDADFDHLNGLFLDVGKIAL
jgi:predicted nucleic acid-binding protein